MRVSRWLVVSAAAAVLACAGGCAAKKRELTPGDWWPAGKRWKRAAVGALKDPATWVPAAGAVVTSLGDIDQELSDSAVRHTPLFGSPEDADDTSDLLSSATRLALIGTALALPNGEGAWEHRFERLVLEDLIVRANGLVTDQLKEAVGRTRPDGSDDRSFPSGHSSTAFARAALANRNVDAMGISRGGKLALKTTFTTLAAGAAWARVEAGVHYPSDVFAGAALGNFLSRFLHDAFLPADRNVELEVVVGRDEVSAAVRIALPAGR